MLLVIDVGNTNIVAGVFDGKKIASHWRFSTDRDCAFVPHVRALF